MRPQSVPDVLDALRQNRLVEPARLSAFLVRHAPADVPALLERLAAEGLLTPFQAEAVGTGRGAELWMGGYLVQNRLGRGGMGHVFLAEHAVLGRRVALKALSDALRADPGARRRFVREARAAAALDHPNIVRVFDVNMNHEPPYLVMEYVDGVSLQAAVARTGTFSAGETAAVGIQVGDGLARAAAVGLVHRDIKPANLLVDRCGAVKILDLGIARFTQESNSRIHGTAVILGTLDYLAPEQAEDSSAVDPRADLYALGATLYFLLAGHPPFPVADLRRKLAAKSTEDPPPIHRLRPDVPDEFSAVVQRLLARDPTDRYPDAAAAVAALRPWAAPGTDFPARLFRLASDSTAHEPRCTDHPPSDDPMPETVRILKPLARPAAPAEPAPPAGPTDGTGPAPPPGREQADSVPSRPPPTEKAFDFEGADTESTSAGSAPTDEMLAIPPELNGLPDPGSLTPPAAPLFSGARARPAPAGTRSRWPWPTVLGLGVVALALTAGAVALVWLARR